MPRNILYMLDPMCVYVTGCICMCIYIYVSARFCCMLRYQNGKKVKASEYPGLEELCTICGMCNDSSVDYNEVRICSSDTNDSDNNTFLEQSDIGMNSTEKITSKRFVCTWLHQTRGTKAACEMGQRPCSSIPISDASRHFVNA